MALLSRAYARKRKRYRDNIANRDQANNSDIEKWDLCRLTGRSHQSLLKEAAFSTNIYDFCQKLGYARGRGSYLRTIDNRYWAVLFDFIIEFRYFWQRQLKLMSNLDITAPENEKQLQLFAGILGIDLDKLQIILAGAADIQKLNDLMRPLLPAIAEAHMARRIIDGKDVQWYLERRLPELYGKQEPESDKFAEKTITIVEKKKE